MSDDPILLVEDNSAIALVITTILMAHGAEVMRAASGDDALAIVEGRAISCLITDLNLPGSMNGNGLGQRLRQHCPALPVILISGDFEEGVGRDDLLEKAELLPKPFRRADLLAALENAKRRTCR